MSELNPIKLKAEKSHLVFEQATALVVATINNRPALYDAKALAEKLATAHNDFPRAQELLRAAQQIGSKMVANQFHEDYAAEFKMLLIEISKHLNP